MGHLVRGVQMLRSYGREAAIDRCSDVVDLRLSPGEPPAYACVLEGSTGAALDALQGILRETEWALGKREATLKLWILQYGDQRPGSAPRAFEAIRSGRLEEGMTRVLPGGEFARLCDWGQQEIGAEPGVIGEWPSATGR
ncbi:MAG: hypothetical protein ACOY93_14515 [Bacillota bacterium]